MKLDVQGLRAGYGRKVVVDGIDLHVDDGEFVAVLAANGAGKTTTLKALAGVIPSRGQIVVDERRVDGRPVVERIDAGLALVPEGRQIFPQMTVRENLDLGYELSHRGRRPTGRAEVFDRVMTLFPRLSERAAQLAGTLSGGEQQMLAIGRGLLTEPTVLMLDEPSLGLAPVLVDQLMETLAALNQQGLAILMVEQDVARTLDHVHRAYVLARGQVVLEGTADELRHDPAIQDAFLGTLA
jgi:branched-chain amino acid transport system ATP-binding protein